MSRTISSGSTESIELTANNYLKWKTVSRHPNKKATKAWAMKITGTHDKYGLDGDWMDKQTLDGATHFDTTPLNPGDYIKVSGASHSNNKIAFYRVESINGKIELTRVKESDVVEAVESPDELDELKQTVMNQVSDCDDLETLKRINSDLASPDDD